MLKKLIVEQFVIIEKLDVDFEDKLTIITGETGAGKSIILGALSLILGDPATPKSIRQGHDKSVLKAVFSPPSDHGVWNLLVRQNLANVGEKDFTIDRVISTDGGDDIQINGNAVALDLLKEVGEMLAEIHGQKANHTLLGPENQLNLLDLSGGFPPEFLSNVSEALKEVRRLEHELEDEETFIAGHKGAKLRNIETLVKKFKDIEMTEAAYIQQTEKEYETLLIAKETSEAFQGIISRLISGNGIVGGLSACRRTLEEQDNIDADEIKLLSEQLENSLKNARAAVEEMGRLTPKYEIDIGPLNRKKQILDTLHEISRVTKTPYEEMGNFFTETMHSYNRVKAGRDKIAQLKDDLIEAKNIYREHAKILTEKRIAAGKILSDSITNEFAPLKLPKAQFIVEVEEKQDMEWTEKGFNVVTFTARMNPGMPFSPIAETASGGELARMILALKVVLQRVQTTTTLVFDEVDVGIGGAAAAAVGDCISKLSGNTQVMVITHSPQVASSGDQHLHISKRMEGETTISMMNELQTEQRIEEISRMLAGDKTTDHSHAAAQSLLDEAARLKKEHAATAVQS